MFVVFTARVKIFSFSFFQTIASRISISHPLPFFECHQKVTTHCQLDNGVNSRKQIAPIANNNTPLLGQFSPSDHPQTHFQHDQITRDVESPMHASHSRSFFIEFVGADDGEVRTRAAAAKQKAKNVKKCDEPLLSSPFPSRDLAISDVDTSAWGPSNSESFSQSSRFHLPLIPLSA